MGFPGPTGFDLLVVRFLRLGSELEAAETLFV